MPEATRTVIVGAGPAGLAVAACLTRARQPFVLLEQGHGVADRWRSRYRRLHLHTAKQYSALPYLPFPSAHPRYPSRHQVVEYLEGYARHFGIAPRFGERVVALARDDGTWTVTTSGASYRAKHVVLCTGHSDVPRRPTWPGLETFRGETLHSAEYESGGRFSGRRVLVIGLGNSGGEIAIDLAEAGARAEIAVRGPVNVVPRDFLGQPIQRSTILLSRLPVAVRDRIGRTISRLAFGDLTALGLPAPREGPVSGIVGRGRIPLIDVGTIALVRSGKIGLRSGVRRFDDDRVTFADGTTASFDAVIFATGYEAGMAKLVAPLDLPTDARGLPHADGLHLVGFTPPPTGLLREIAIEARRVAARIGAA